MVTIVFINDPVRSSSDEDDAAASTELVECLNLAGSFVSAKVADIFAMMDGPL